jgi:hypothetical protein
MYEITYGSKYESVKGLPLREITALMRKDVKAAVKAGELPADWKYSVTMKGGAIYPVATAPRPVYAADPDSYPFAFNYETGKYVTGYENRRTAEATEVYEVLTGILNSYNYNGSDVMTDYFNVNFYGYVRVTGPEFVAPYEVASIS